MILLTSTSDKIQIITASGVSIDVHASYMDYDGVSTVTPARKNTAIPTATTTDVVGAPGSGVSRNVKHLNIRNAHASSSNLVTVQHTDGSIVPTLYSYTLLAGEEIVYADGEGWAVFDASGNLKTTTATSTLLESPTTQVLTAGYTLTGNMSLLANRSFTINSGIRLSLASGARFRIL